MYITNAYKDTTTWHTGETLVLPLGRVLTFQADGDELEMVVVALRAAGVTVEVVNPSVGERVVSQSTESMTIDLASGVVTRSDFSCEWCSAAKKNPYGLCGKCFRFPVKRVVR